MVEPFSGDSLSFPLSSATSRHQGMDMRFFLLLTLRRETDDMSKHEQLQLFQSQRVRSVWDDEQEEWYFSVVDVVAVLTDSTNPTDYIKKMRKRDPELAKGWGQIVTPLSLVTNGGKQRTNCATLEGTFRIIQSIPSPKAEPFKQWMAQVAAHRIDQMQDPELDIQQAIRKKVLASMMKSPPEVDEVGKKPYPISLRSRYRRGRLLPRAR